MHALQVHIGIFLLVLWRAATAESTAAAAVPFLDPTLQLLCQLVYAPITNERFPGCRSQNAYMTQYWLPKENEWDEADADGRRIYLGDPEPRVPLTGPNNKPLAMVPESMIKRCIMEGACLLANGDLVHLHNGHVFEVIGHKGRRQNLFGYGASIQNLVPFVSVAANNLPQGTTMYIPELNGVILPMGTKHNGCVRVDDTGPGIAGKHLMSQLGSRAIFQLVEYVDCQLDLFVVSYIDYLSLDMPDRITPQLRSCSVRNYVTKEYLAFVGASTDNAVLANAINDKAVPFQ